MRWVMLVLTSPLWLPFALAYIVVAMVLLGFTSILSCLWYSFTNEWINPWAW